MRLASLARVARDFGNRACAVEALQRLLDGIISRNTLAFNEPFLAPVDRFDLIPVGPSISNWMLAAVLEAIERLGSYSSYYTGTSALPRLKRIRDLGFGSAEMDRRLSLVQRRFGLPEGAHEIARRAGSCRPFPPLVALKETLYGRMLIPASSQQGTSSGIEAGEMNPEVLGLFSHFISTGAIVLDIGAGFGTHTVPLAQLVGSGGVVVAFEPQPEAYKTLCANLVLNSVPNVLTYAMALGASEGECMLRVVDASDPDGLGDEAEGEVVPLGKLDDFQLDRVDFVRLGAGGNESTVLEGALDTIQRCRPIMYISNDHAENSAALIQRLFDLGYRLWWHAPARLKPEYDLVTTETNSREASSIAMLAIHCDMRPITGLKPITAANDTWQ